MNKRISSRAIIIDNNAIIALFRRKIKEDGSVKEYYAIPGGGIEEGETLEENIKREIKEELGLEIAILGYLGKEEDELSITHFFHCQRISGIPLIGGPEVERNNPKNYYEIRYLNLNDIYNAEIAYKNIIEKAIRSEYIK